VDGGGGGGILRGEEFEHLEGGESVEVFRGGVAGLGREGGEVVHEVMIILRRADGGCGLSHHCAGIDDMGREAGPSTTPLRGFAQDDDERQGYPQYAARCGGIRAAQLADAEGTTGDSADSDMRN